MGGIFGDIFGEGGEASSQSPTAFQSLPQEAQDAFLSFLTRGQGLSTSSEPFAPVGFVPEQLQALQALTGGFQGQQGVVPLGFTKSAQRNLGAGENFLSGVGGQIGQSGQFLEQAGGNILAGTTALTPTNISQGIASFQNPFESQVIGQLGEDIKKQLQGQISDIGAGATSAGAFGGTRQALGESLARENAQQTFAREAGQLRNQGFQQSASNALTNLIAERERFLQGAGLNINQSGQALSAAGQLTNAAGQSGNLAGVGLSGRQINLGQNQQGNMQAFEQFLRGQTAALGAGNTLQQPLIQEQQIPLQQLELLRNVLGAFPVGGGGSSQSTQTNDGILGRFFGK